MPVTLLDIFLLVVMLISGLLAMIRGFMREILSIAAWGIAALVTVYLFPRAAAIAQQYIGNEMASKGVAIIGVFLVTLLVISVITVRISDLILDSRVGALDRTLGFLFGLARGFLIVVIAYTFFDWFVPAKKPDWIQNSKSLVALKESGDWLKSKLPDDPEGLINKMRRPKPENQDPLDTGPERTDIAPRPSPPAASPAPAPAAPRPMQDVIQSKPPGNPSGTQ
jgi:membrane protein required for colicin V production